MNPKQAIMQNNESKICAECGGGCCKNYPGGYHPDDVDFDQIVAKLKSHEWAIDWWEADDHLYFLRPAVKGDDNIMSPSWGGECFYLQESGCKLSFEGRPHACKDLKPKTEPKGRCFGDFGKLETGQSWKSHKDELLRFAKEAKHGN